MRPEIEIDHIGIAVEGIDSAMPFWKLLGWQKGPTETVPEQKVEVAMLPLVNDARVELLEATEAESPISKFISKRGPGVHHVCFRVKNIDSILSHLKSNGVKLINETAVAGAHGCRVAFIHPQSTGGILVELSEGHKSKKERP
jgi:methylmalonyl-CoA/ethylmalonyl-CoA epimerase